MLAGRRAVFLSLAEAFIPFGDECGRGRVSGEVSVIPTPRSGAGGWKMPGQKSTSPSGLSNVIQAGCRHYGGPASFLISTKTSAWERWDTSVSLPCGEIVIHSALAFGAGPFRLKAGLPWRRHGVVCPVSITTQSPSPAIQERSLWSYLSSQFPAAAGSTG